MPDFGLGPVFLSIVSSSDRFSPAIYELQLLRGAASLSSRPLGGPKCSFAKKNLNLFVLKIEAKTISFFFSAHFFL